MIYKGDFKKNKKKNANNCVFYGKLFEYKKFKAVLTIAYNTVKCKF